MSCDLTVPLTNFHVTSKLKFLNAVYYKAESKWEHDANNQAVCIYLPAGCLITTK